MSIFDQTLLNEEILKSNQFVNNGLNESIEEANKSIEYLKHIENEII